MSVALPTGWTWRTLGDLAVEGPVNGYSGATGSDAQGSPTLRLSATSSGYFLMNEATTKRLYETIESDSGLWLRPGDLLVQRSNTLELVGTTAIYDGPPGAYVYPDLMMRLRLGDPILTRWVWRYMNGPEARAFYGRMAAGSAGSMPKISGQKLRQLPIPLPPREEQHRIADILDKADALRRKRREALQLTDDLLRSVFLDMFGDPVTNPRGWEIVPLGEVASFVGGGTPSRAEPDFFQGSICWATAKDMGVQILTDTEEHITSEAIERSATKLVPAGTVLVVVKSKVLAHRLPVAVTAVPTCFGQDLKGIVPREDWPAAYLAQQLRLGAEQLLRQARGANTEGLTLDHLRAFPVFLVPAALRSRYSELDSKLRSHRRLHVEALGVAETVFNTLLHRAFTGEL